MHFRRMDPQPERNVTVVAGSQLLTWWAGEPPAVINPPVDMPGARPWQDRDGEWYWRRELPEPSHDEQCSCVGDPETGGCIYDATD